MSSKADKIRKLIDFVEKAKTISIQHLSERADGADKNLQSLSRDIQAIIKALNELGANLDGVKGELKSLPLDERISELASQLQTELSQLESGLESNKGEISAVEKKLLKEVEKTTKKLEKDLAEKVKLDIIEIGVSDEQKKDIVSQATEKAEELIDNKLKESNSDLKSSILKAMPKNPNPYAGGSGATFLKSLRDITNAKTATDGQVLKKNASGTFTFEDESGGGGGGLDNVVEDTTPQLGGNLDVNGFTITSATNGDVTIDPNGTGTILIGSDIDMQENDILDLQSLQFHTTPASIPTAEGSVWWDSTNQSLAVKNAESDITLQVGQENWIRVYNNSGGTINNGEVVYASGKEDVENRLTIAKAQADDPATSKVIGFATHDIENSSFGYITQFGYVNDFDTSAFSDGASIWLSADTAGAFTATEPTPPNESVFLGYVSDSHATTGNVFITTLGNTSGATPTLTTTITADTSPAITQRTYFIDTSLNDVTLTLPDTSADNDGEIIRIVLIDATNQAVVDTVSGTDLVGTVTSQSIIQAETGFTVQSDNSTSTWHIIQDSRAKTPFSNLTFYGLTESGAVGGYNRLCVSTDDSDFSTTASDVTTGAITGSAQAVGSWVADQGELQGLLTETNAQFVFNVRRTAGSGTAEFYAEIYHRNSGGTETLLGTSGVSAPVVSASYVQRDITAFVSEQLFASTDYIVIKFFANRIPGGSDPTYDIQVEGVTSPARMILAVSSSLIPHNSLTGLAWTSSGHTGTANHIPYFDGSGDAASSSTLRTDGSGSIFLTERASAGTDNVGDGQFWVKNDAPNTPYFTDDAGTDFRLLGGVGALDSMELLYWDGDSAQTVGVGTVSGSSVSWLDNRFNIVDNVDNTKLLKFTIDGQNSASTTEILTGAVAEEGSIQLTLPATTDTIVGRDTTDALINKDISAASNTYRAASTTVDGAVELATTAETTTGTDTTRAVTPDGLADSTFTDEIYIDAGAMKSRATNGAEASGEEYATNDINVDYFLFAGGTANEAAQFKIAMPGSWDNGTIKVKFYWDAASGASAADGVVWGISAGALADNDAIDTALGTQVHVDDVVIAVGDMHITAATAAVTVAGTPAVDDMVVFEVERLQDDVNDDMTEDAKLLGVKIQFTKTRGATAW